MSQIEVERFLGRLITDANFRVSVAASLTTASYKEGFNLSAEEISLLRSLDFSLFCRVAGTVDTAILRNGLGSNGG